MTQPMGNHLERLNRLLDDLAAERDVAERAALSAADVELADTTDFDAGEGGMLPTGQTVHTYRFVAVAKTVEIAPGVMYPAWTYNGRIPGPTIRVRQGGRVRIAFTNTTDHAHGVHVHGLHPGSMDDAMAQVPRGGLFAYEIDAEPFGVHLYHCHAIPLAEHLVRGLVNILEFDPINSFYLPANFFHYYPTGTNRTPREYTDTIAQMQGQRGLLEFRYRYPGRYLFHAHKTEFAELGWSGLFQVVEA